MALIIIICIVSIICLTVSFLQWKNIVTRRESNKNLIAKRKKYKNYSTLSMVILLCSLLYIFGQDIDSVSLGIIIGLAFCSNKMWFEPYFTAEDVNKINRLCLYLRPFAIDGDVSKGHAIKGRFLIPETIEKYLCNELNQLIAQTFSVGIPESNVPTTQNSSPIFFTDSEWQCNVKKLANMSKVIVLHIAGTDGCKWELGICTEDSSILTKTIFLIDSENSLQILMDRFNLTEDDIKLKLPSKCVAVYYDSKNKRWNHVELINKRDIKKLISNFIVCNNINTEDEKSNKSKIPAIGWQVLAFIQNPVAYIGIARIPLFISITTIVFLICLAIVVGEFFGLSLVPYIIVSILSLIICGLILSHLNWKGHHYANKFFFAQKYRSLAIWLLILWCVDMLLNIIALI